MPAILFESSANQRLSRGYSLAMNPPSEQPDGELAQTIHWTIRTQWFRPWWSDASLRRLAFRDIRARSETRVSDG